MSTCRSPFPNAALRIRMTTVKGGRLKDGDTLVRRVDQSQSSLVEVTGGTSSVLVRHFGVLNFEFETQVAQLPLSWFFS
jgi:hypothetical protein